MIEVYWVNYASEYRSHRSDNDETYTEVDLALLQPVHVDDVHDA